MQTASSATIASLWLSLPAVILVFSLVRGNKSAPNLISNAPCLRLTTLRLMSEQNEDLEQVLLTYSAQQAKVKKGSFPRARDLALFNSVYFLQGYGKP